MSKYNTLWTFVKQDGREVFSLTFAQIQEILGFPIDHSFLNYKKELHEFGYQVGKISLKQQTVNFIKLTS